ncbi:Uncharacterised protein [Burkholderia pseudomallei]|nr:hypothetical protein JT30_3421 [Burkholderia pseudomallei]CAJ7500156.1 Uncharacterised protein [Burkholderia pseudomallei]
MPDGIRRISVSNRPLAPTAASSSAQTTNAPIASEYATPGSDATRSAAPGVDHATTIGARYRSDNPIVVTAMPIDSAQIHDEICASLRCAARPAWNISTSELV